ncbi:hypothetical protein SAMN05444372_12015 [Flavobacterium micromati]|uniref:Uncharacterized protein n=1 Tax=Flavobacterium micromati TaxID=229205 RepID=A0A1M5QVK3_9FLAO|nr:hypothetical protein [Flavobacterium micromati]SHH18184.1 hypothetical protein SAMN05444372_12015 [Flavobacterium micromati]
MKSILNNPYKIAGILANSSEKDILKQKSKIKRFSEVGKEITSEYDFSFLNAIQRTNSIIDKAFSDIEQNQSKVLHSLFWFTNLNTVDNTAIQHLITGNKEKAIEIWDKLTDEKEVTSKNFSAFNNIGTLYLLENSKEEIKQGITAKIKLLASDNFKDFVRTVADETFSIDKNKQIEIFIDELLTQFKGKYSTAKTMQLFSNCDAITQKYLSKKFTEEPIHKIETQIEQCTKKRSKDKSNAYKFGTDLYSNTKIELTFLKSIVGNTNLQYKMLADNIAKELQQCSIDYFNESQELERSSDYLEEAMKLAKLAESVAVNEATKSKTKENISSLEEMKDKKLFEVTMFLKSVKEAYSENENEIRQEVKRMEQTDILIKMGHKTINWDAVNDNIKNSINWQNVNELLVEILTDSNLKKIKESEKQEAKKEFWELIKWTEDNSLKSSTISRIVEKYKTISPKLCFEILSSAVTNTDSNSKAVENPFFVEDIRYVGLKLNVNSTGTQKVTIYKKYLNPDGTIKRSAKDSPKNYSTSKDFTITPMTKIIDLEGYGNAKECTYMVGEHKIEIYIEHYKIFTKTFQVDWTPNKKADLTKIIQLLENELREVEKFQWFRASETKQNEVKAVQEKIKKAKQTLMNK